MALAACGSHPPAPPITSSSTSSTPPPPPTTVAAQPSLLSGRPGAVDGRVIVVKIDNTEPSHPQVGVEAADVVYIEEVEAGLTRLAAVFSTQMPARIGPVRSARITDLELMSQYGPVGFAYSGANRKLQPSIATANVVDVGADRLSGAYSRASDRRAPYNLMASGPQLQAAALKRKVPPARSMGWSFGPAPVAGGKPTRAVGVRYTSASVRFTWNAGSGRWELSMGGQPSRNPAGAALGGTTVIVQQVRSQDSGYHDVNGMPTPYLRTVGSGKAWIAREGQVWQGTWTRPTAKQSTRYLVGGAPMPFAGGQIWVVLVPPSASVAVNQ